MKSFNVQWTHRKKRYKSFTNVSEVVLCLESITWFPGVNSAPPNAKISRFSPENVIFSMSPDWLQNRNLYIHADNSCTTHCYNTSYIQNNKENAWHVEVAVDGVHHSLCAGCVLSTINNTTPQMSTLNKFAVDIGLHWPFMLLRPHV